MSKVYRERLEERGFTCINETLPVETGHYDMIEEAHIQLGDEVFVLNDGEERALYNYLLVRKQRREDQETEKLVLEKFGQSTSVISDAVAATLATGKTTTIVEAAENWEDIEACPGCGNKPGDGINPECNSPVGCGYWKSLDAQDNCRF